MKKLLAIVLATVMVVSMFAVSASAFMDVIENFDSLPAGLEGREDVAIQQNKALKITHTATEWGYKGWIQFSDELIDYDSTVSFYFKTNEYPDGWCHRMALALSDAIGKINESQTMGGIATNGNKGRTVGSRSLGYITYLADAEVPASAVVYPNALEGDENYSDDGDFIEVLADTWYRVDLLVDFTNKTTEIYINGALYATANHSPNAVGYKGFKAFEFSSGNYEQEFYVDELVVREGLLAPEDGDLIANQDRNAIEADETVKVYEPFDALHSNILSNTNKVPYVAVEVGGFNQSSLLVEVPYGENEFEDLYLPLSDIALEGNATISFKLMNSYTSKKLPGAALKLVDSDMNVIGGIIIGNDAAKLMFDDGENVYLAKDADGEDIAFKSGVWNQIDLLLNADNDSLTVYVNGTRIGTVALENGEINGFTGILMTKYVTTGAKPQKFTFDNFTVVEGLYAPGVEDALDPNDELVQIDTVYVEETTPTPTTKAPDPETTPEDNNNETTPADNDVTTKAPETDAPKADEGSCGGVSLGAVVALAVGMFGLGFTVIKKK